MSDCVSEFYVVHVEDAERWHGDILQLSRSPYVMLQIAELQPGQAYTFGMPTQTYIMPRAQGVKTGARLQDIPENATCLDTFSF